MMNYGEHFNWMMSGIGTTSMIMMMLFHIAVLVGGIYFIIYLVRTFSKDKANENVVSGVSILNERFAKGEITEDEYKRMKRTLETDV
ncbi:MAG: SHOCT domain-containing protein [Bacillaceae bacterium]|uniref:SHOCT domain-containing protein n=1 Tax=Alkalihalobacterium chitinilyticum TaxID=2980103 RepID=A0ABT5VDY0_9BACI|nr:SHOCT domain-containing protein [Alkalihalobacterium chitinilyticum]MDE5413675.1 SHOCT domain-containing protein [Alkalihalobacterium chitinilyticum]MEB1806082.1 SHOCT domain-containing protein [Bacillaceae bacterium]